MPDFRQHTNLNVDLYIIFLIIAAGSGYLKIIPHSLGFLFGTFWGSPDCDMPNSIPNQNWGHLGIYLDKYALIFPHRGTKKYGASHWFIIGTFTRFIFLTPLIIIFTELTSLFNPEIYEIIKNWIFSLNGLLFFGWWCLADAVHILLDKVQDIATNGRRAYRSIIKIRGSGIEKDLIIKRYSDDRKKQKINIRSFGSNTNTESYERKKTYKTIR